jgi:hypothetical protein
MDQWDARNYRLKRCFIVATADLDTSGIARLLNERGVECLEADDLSPSNILTEELLRHLVAADFIVALVGTSPSANVFFELGVGFSFGKPALVFTKESYSSTDFLRGLYVSRVADLTKTEDVANHIDRFLKHAKSPDPIHMPEPSPQKPSDLSWAKTRLTQMRASEPGDREQALEQLVADLLRRAGAEVSPTEMNSAKPISDNIDLVVWLNDVAYETGGPILVECKTYRGGTGSIVKNAEHAVRKLDKFVQESSAKLAFLVVDYDRNRRPPCVHETPRVLVFPVDTLIEALERGTLAEQVVERRRRAAFAPGDMSAN